MFQRSHPHEVATSQEGHADRAMAEKDPKPLVRLSPFAAGAPDEPGPKGSPFATESSVETPTESSTADIARELAALTGESIPEAVERALKERLDRYRRRDVGIAERLSRLSREVAQLRTGSAAEHAHRPGPPDEGVAARPQEKRSSGAPNRHRVVGGHR